MSNTPIAKADLIEGMAKGMAVLESFDTERQRLNATQAAERAGLTRAAARRHLLTLAHLGYLDTDGSHYWLAPKVLRFSGSYLASARLPRVLQPTLNRLAALTRESFSAVVLDRDEVVIVARSATVGGQRLEVTDLQLPQGGEMGFYFVESLTRPQVNPLVGWSQGHFLIEPRADGRPGVLTAHHEPVFGVSSPEQAPVTAAMNTFSKGVAKGVIVQESLSAMAASAPMPVDEFKRSVRALVQQP